MYKIIEGMLTITEETLDGYCEKVLCADCEYFNNADKNEKEQVCTYINGFSESMIHWSKP